MSKYFNEDGSLKSIYMEKIQPLLDEVDRKYNDERDLLTAAMPAKKRAYEIAKLNHENACKALEAAYLSWMSGDNGFGMAMARNKQKDRILRDCLKTFQDLADAEETAEEKARKKQQIANNLCRMGLNIKENRFLSRPESLKVSDFNEKDDESED